MSTHAGGREVRGLIISDDISTAVAFTLYDQATQDTVTMRSQDRLIVYMVAIHNGDSAAVVQVFDDKDGDAAVDAGEQLFGGSMNAKALEGYESKRGIALLRIPKAIASGASANTKIFLYGEVQLGSPLL